MKSYQNSKLNLFRDKAKKKGFFTINIQNQSQYNDIREQASNVWLEIKNRSEFTGKDNNDSYYGGLFIEHGFNEYLHFIGAQYEHPGYAYYGNDFKRKRVDLGDYIKEGHLCDIKGSNDGNKLNVSFSERRDICLKYLIGAHLYNSYFYHEALIVIYGLYDVTDIHTDKDVTWRFKGTNNEHALIHPYQFDTDLFKKLFLT